MNKLKYLKGTQDFMKRNKSTKEMLQEQQRALKKGLLGKAEKLFEPQLMVLGGGIKEKKPSIRERKIEILQHQQKELKKKKPLKFFDIY